MAKFTAAVPLKIRLPGGFEIDGASGATHRIPDSLVEEFTRDQAPLIPGGVTWITQDEVSGLASSASVTAAIDAHAISASAHSHFARTDNPHSVSIKLAAAVHGSADISYAVSQGLSTQEAHINSLAFDGRTIVTGTYSQGSIYRSGDLGLTWQGTTAVFATGVDDIAGMLAPRPGVFFAGCSMSGSGSAVFRSTDSGATWLRVMQAATSESTEGMSLCAGWDGTLLAGSYNATSGYARIWRSLDNGDTWTIVSSTETTKTTIRQIAHVYRNVYIAGVYGATPNESKVFRSSDAGATWAAVQTIASTDIYAVLALGNGVVLLGTHPSGLIYRSTDIGATFTTVANLSGGAAGQSQVYGLARLGKSVLAFVNQGTASNVAVYVSDDEGATWTQVASNLTSTYHFHQPVAVDHRTLVSGASAAIGTAGQLVRFTYYG